MDESFILTIHDRGATYSSSISSTRNFYPAILKPSQKGSNPSFSSAAYSLSVLTRNIARSSLHNGQARIRAIKKPVNDESDKVSVGRVSFMPKKEVLGPLDKSGWV